MSDKDIISALYEELKVEFVGVNILRVSERSLTLYRHHGLGVCMGFMDGQYRIDNVTISKRRKYDASDPNSIDALITEIRRQLDEYDRIGWGLNENVGKVDDRPSGTPPHQGQVRMVE